MNNIGFLLVPHCYKSAISNRLRRIQQRYKQTDGRTDRMVIAIVDLTDAARYALASVAKRTMHVYSAECRR